jgi:hypothetical protein
MKQVVVLLLAVLSFHPVSAATRSELVERYGVDPDSDQISPETAYVIDQHNHKPLLKEMDLDNDLKVSKAEFDSWSAKKWADAQEEAKEARIESNPTKPGDIFEQGRNAEVRKKGIPVSALITEEDPVPVDPCNDPKQLFIRRDKLDNWMFDRADASEAEGASASYLKDWENSLSNLSVDGMVGFTLWRDACRNPAGRELGTPYVSAFAIVPWLSANGNRSSDHQESSSLRLGIDLQAELAETRPFDLSYFTVSPYYQTDFRGDANAYGIQASWTPFWLEARLGGNDRVDDDPLDWFWQFSAEADYISVQDVGSTELAEKDYGWVGFTAKVHFFPFADSQNDYLAGRVRLTGTAHHYWDLVSGEHISDYLGELAYDLDPSGSTSISLGYENGTRKETLADIDQVLLKLNYKY